MAAWYYLVGQDRQGPMDAGDIVRLIGSGDISGDTLVWRKGLSGWEPASNHFSFGSEADVPPPVDQVAPPRADTRPITPIPGPSATPVSDQTPAPSPAYGAAPANGQIGPDGLYVGAPSREFVEAAKVCLSKYATFSGRASRSEFWFFYLFYILIVMVAQVIDIAIIAAIAASGVPFFIPIFSFIVILGMILPQLAVSWRRLHDIDRTGWWLGGAMLASIAFYAVIIGFVVVADAGGGDLPSEPPVGFFVAFGLFMLLSLAYGITIFIFYLTKGTLGPNRFG